MLSIEHRALRRRRRSPRSDGLFVDETFSLTSWRHFSDSTQLNSTQKCCCPLERESSEGTSVDIGSQPFRVAQHTHILSLSRVCVCQTGELIVVYKQLETSKLSTPKRQNSHPCVVVMEPETSDDGLLSSSSSVRAVQYCCERPVFFVA